jgi:hypothetical protein
MNALELLVFIALETSEWEKSLKPKLNVSSRFGAAIVEARRIARTTNIAVVSKPRMVVLQQTKKKDDRWAQAVPHSL